MIKIDKKVPIPRSGGAKYPWADMKIGDSFYVENVTQASLNSVAYGWAMRHNSKIKFRTSKEKNGVRVWRIK